MAQQHKKTSRRSVVSSLRAQLMLTTLFPVIALLIALTGVGVFSFTRLTQTLIEKRDAELVQLAARQVADYLADSVLLLSQVASTDSVRMGDAAAGQALLSANVALRQRFDQLSITDARGKIIATEGGRLGENVSQLDYFDRARRLRRPIKSGIHEVEGGPPIIVVAQPIYDLLGGQFAGCALGIWQLDKDRLGLPVANVRVGENGFAYLVDESGTILYHRSKELLGADSHQHPAVMALLRGETGSLTVNDGGRITVVGYAPIPLRQLTNSLMADNSWDGWGLLTSELWNDIVAPLQPYVSLMIVLLLLVVTIPLSFLALNSRRIAAPLQSLVAEAGRVAAGRFDSRVSLNVGPWEVRELELAFNTMVEELRRYRGDIQNYVVSILNSQEEERKRIARELHDETAQALIVLGRHIETAEELADNDDLSAELEAIRDMVDDTLQGVRRFTSDLRPPLLEELGLPRTLELLGARTEREESFAVNVAVIGAPRQLLPEIELGLYRLAQEGLTNVRKHAHASHVEMQLTYAEDAVTLEVKDDGRGFKAPTDPTDLIRLGRLGLMGINERARLFGGKATIISEPGQGTTISVVIPITSIVLPLSPEGAKEGVARGPESV